MSSTVDHLFESADNYLKKPIYTIDLTRWNGMTEAEMDELKKRLRENGYVFSDGRKNGWQKLWVMKKES